MRSLDSHPMRFQPHQSDCRHLPQADAIDISRHPVLWLRLHWIISFISASYLLLTIFLSYLTSIWTHIVHVTSPLQNQSINSTHPTVAQTGSGTKFRFDSRCQFKSIINEKKRTFSTRNSQLLLTWQTGTASWRLIKFTLCVYVIIVLVTPCFNRISLIQLTTS